jgi:acetyl-CoA acetyltransferase
MVFRAYSLSLNVEVLKQEARAGFQLACNLYLQRYEELHVAGQSAMPMLCSEVVTKHFGNSVNVSGGGVAGAPLNCKRPQGIREVVFVPYQMQERVAQLEKGPCL